MHAIIPHGRLNVLSHAVDTIALCLHRSFTNRANSKCGGGDEGKGGARRAYTHLPFNNNRVVRILHSGMRACRGGLPDFGTQVMSRLNVQVCTSANISSPFSPPSTFPFSPFTLLRIHRVCITDCNTLRVALEVGWTVPSMKRAKL